MYNKTNICFIDATFFSFLRLKVKKEIAVKKLVVLLSLVFSVLSCEPDNDKPIEFSLELVPIENVRLPEFFVEGQTYEIEMQYIRISACHFPNAVYYSQENEQEISYEETPIAPIEIIHNKSIVTVSVENIIFKGNDCNVEIPRDQQIVNAVLKLKIDQPAGTIYEFKFLKGRDAQENPIYFIERVVVGEKERHVWDLAIENKR